MRDTGASERRDDERFGSSAQPSTPERRHVSTYIDRRCSQAAMLRMHYARSSLRKRRIARRAREVLAFFLINRPCEQGSEGDSS